VGGVPLLTSKEPGYHLELEKQLSEAIGNAVPVTSDVSCYLAAARALGLKRVALTLAVPALHPGQRQAPPESPRHRDGGRRLPRLQAGRVHDEGGNGQRLPGRFAGLQRGQGGRRHAPVLPAVAGDPQRAQGRAEMGGKPVVGHMAAIMWGALSQIGVNAAQPGFGRLLEQWPAWPGTVTALVEQERRWPAKQRH
jgi:hypothetical protein